LFRREADWLAIRLGQRKSHESADCGVAESDEEYCQPAEDEKLGRPFM
jgi:hypothetical protein